MKLENVYWGRPKVKNTYWLTVREFRERGSCQLEYPLNPWYTWKIEKSDKKLVIAKMSSYSNIIVEVKNKLAVITLNRPKKKNAIDSVMYHELTDALQNISKDDNVAITVLTGSGEYYCSGTDLKTSLGNTNESFDAIIEKSAVTLRQFVEAFIDHSKILVALVNGPAIGIAVTTLALCDIVYCVDNAIFQTPFTRLGMCCEGCSSVTFPAIFGVSKANDLLLFNRVLSAKEACDAGLVAKVYTKQEVDTVLWPQLRENALKLPMKSLLYSKQLMRRFNENILHEANRNECLRLRERWRSEDCLNAIMSFMNRRSKM